MTPVEKLQPDPADFIDRKLNRQGNTYLLAMGRVLPNDWSAVRVRVLDRSPELVTITIERNA